MKSRTVVLLGVSVVTSLSGCVHSHHAPMVYEATPVYPAQTVVVAPTSERPIVRVYPEPDTAVRVVPSQVQSKDVEVADTIRRMFQSDATLSTIARNVQITVFEGKATMTG